MLILPTFSIKLVYLATVSTIGVISASEQHLILLTYLLNVVFEKSSLDIVDVTFGWSFWELSERFTFTLHVLCSLEVVYPSERYYPIDWLLILQINVLMLVHSPAASAVHHYLLFFIYCVATFSSGQVILTRNRIKVNSWYLYEDILSCDVKFQVL